MNRYKAIVFDMDGLMVDSEPLSRQAWDEFLRPYGGHISDEMQARMIGLRADVSTPFIREAFNVPLPVAEIIARRKAIHTRLLAKGVPAMPGLRALLSALAMRGLPWAVASSSNHTHVHEILAQLQLTDKVAATACGDEVAHGKPAPDLYLLAAKRLAISPEQCLALEDSAPGSRAAAAAGMLTVVIPHGHTREADFSHAHHIYSSLYGVLHNLDALLA